MKTYRVDKTWARDQRRMRRHRMRTHICLLGWLPLIVTGALFVYDRDQQMSIFELLPAYRNITYHQWFTAWLWILGSCAVLGTALMLVFWRCPACRRFLGDQLSPGRCPHCDAKLS